MIRSGVVMENGHKIFKSKTAAWTQSSEMPSTPLTGLTPSAAEVIGELLNPARKTLKYTTSPTRTVVTHSDECQMHPEPLRERSFTFLGGVFLSLPSVLKTNSRLERDKEAATVSLFWRNVVQQIKNGAPFSFLASRISGDDQKQIA